MREVAEPSAVTVARAALTRFAEREGASETVRSALALAVTEACANVVHPRLCRSRRSRRAGGARLRRRGVLVVEVADEGRGMVPRIDGPGLGLGLPVIAQMADIFEILARPDRPGVVVRMHFNLAGTPGTYR